MGKGMNGWTKWLVGVLFTVVFTAVTTLTSYVIANDKDSRDRDTLIKSELVGCVKEQMLTNQQILIALAEIKTELTQKKKDGRNN